MFPSNYTISNYIFFFFFTLLTHITYVQIQLLICSPSIFNILINLNFLFLYNFFIFFHSLIFQSTSLRFCKHFLIVIIFIIIFFIRRQFFNFFNLFLCFNHWPIYQDFLGFFWVLNYRFWWQ